MLNPLQMQGGPWGAIQGNAAMIHDAEDGRGNQWDPAEAAMHQERMFRMQSDLDTRAREHVAQLERQAAEQTRRMDNHAALAGIPVDEEFIAKQTAARERQKQLQKSRIMADAEHVKAQQGGEQTLWKTRNELSNVLSGYRSRAQHNKNEIERISPHMKQIMDRIVSGEYDIASNVDPSINGALVDRVDPLAPAGMAEAIGGPMMQAFSNESPGAARLKLRPGAHDLLSDETYRTEKAWLGDAPQGRNPARADRLLAALATDMVSEVLLPPDKQMRGKAILEDAIYLMLKMPTSDDSDAGHQAIAAIQDQLAPKIEQLQQLGIDPDSVAQVIGSLGSQMQAQLIGAANPDGTRNPAGSILAEMQARAPNFADTSWAGRLGSAVAQSATRAWGGEYHSSSQVSPEYKKLVLQKSIADRLSQLGDRAEASLSGNRYARQKNFEELLKTLDEVLQGPNVVVPGEQEFSGKMAKMLGRPGVREFVAEDRAHGGVFDPGVAAGIQKEKQDIADITEMLADETFDNPEAVGVTPSVRSAVSRERKTLESKALQDQLQGLLGEEIR